MANTMTTGKNNTDSSESSDEIGIDALKSNIVSKKTTEKHLLSEHYQILTEKPLPQFNSSVAKAFEVIDKKNKQSVYAILLPNTLPIRFGALQKLRKIYHPSLCNIVDAGFVDVADGQYGNFAIISERPNGVILRDYILSLERQLREDGTKDYFLPEQFIASKIVEPINEIFLLCKNEGLTHGNINHTKIYVEITDGVVKIKLLEPLSEPCGLSQPIQYETIHRAQTKPLGKGESIIKDDYFALGVLVYYCMFGEVPDTKNNDVNFISERLENGTYSTYLGNTEVTTRMVDAIRGLLHDLNDERWGYEEVSEWIRGKRFNLIRPTIRKESQRSYVFKDRKHYTRRALAYHYSNDWEEAATDIRTKKIVKWLELSVGEIYTGEEIEALVLAAGEEKARARKTENELIAKTLICLDPAGPIRFKNISTQIDGLGCLLADAWARRNQIEINEIKEIFGLNLPDFKVLKDVETDRSSDRWLLQRLNNFISIDGYGFGVERCLYDLNPGLPCQSQLLGNQFLIDINNLIHFLNDNADKMTNFEPVDRHIAGFIGARLELTKPLEPFIQGLSLSPRLKERLAKTMLLSYVQKKTAINRLNNLCEWLGTLLIEDFAKLINSKSLRENFVRDLQKAAKTGIISNILDVMTNGNFFIKNKSELMEAKTEFSQLNNHLRYIEKNLADAKKYKTFYLTGLYLAKVISILVFVLVISVSSL